MFLGLGLSRFRFMSNQVEGVLAVVSPPFPRCCLARVLLIFLEWRSTPCIEARSASLSGLGILKVLNNIATRMSYKFRTFFSSRGSLNIFPRGWRTFGNSLNYCHLLNILSNKLSNAIDVQRTSSPACVRSHQRPQGKLGFRH